MGLVRTAGRIIIAALMAAAVLLPGYSFAAGLRPENFMYYSEIRGNIQKNRLYGMRLNGDLLLKCSSDCGDIRLLDPEGREIPYVIVEDRIAPGKPASYRLEIIEFREEGDTIIITAKMPEKAEGVSVIRIDTPERDFKVTCLFETSSDMKSWSVLDKLVLYDFSSQVDLRKVDIRFGSSVFKYVRLTLGRESGPDKAAQEQMHLNYNGLDFSVSGVVPKKMRINGIWAENPVEGSDKIAFGYDEIPYYAPMKTERKNETSFNVLSGFPAERLYFEVRNPYYYRRVRISPVAQNSRGPLPESYETIYSFPFSYRPESKTYIDLPRPGYRNYQVIIENNNSAQLEITGIRLAWKRRYLIFMTPENVEKVNLHVGSATLGRPVYDLANFVNQENWNKLKAEELSYSAILNTSDYKPAVTDDKKNATEKRLLAGVVIMLVIGLGVWFFLLVRKQSGGGS